MNRSGMTLVELLVVIVILAAVSGMVVAMTDKIDESARYQESDRRLTAIRTALLGPETTTNEGRRINGGYLQDIGSLPTDLADLVRKPSGVPSYDAVMRCGWRGPYLTRLPLRKLADGTVESEPHLYDDWGKDYVLDPGMETDALVLRSTDDSSHPSNGSKPRRSIPLNACRIDLPAFTVRLVNRTSIDFSTMSPSATIRLLRPLAGSPSAIDLPSGLTLALKPAGQADDAWNIPVDFPAQSALAVGLRHLVLWNPTTDKAYGDTPGERFAASCDLLVSPASELPNPVCLEIIRK